MPPQEPRIRTDPTVAEGGVIVVQVATGINELFFHPSGHTTTRVRVVNGRAEFQLPPGVRGGTSVLVSDMKLPAPTSTTVHVVGGQGS